MKQENRPFASREMIEIKRLWRLTRKTLLFGLAFLIVFLGVGLVYQWVGVRNDLPKYKPPGELYDVFGSKMHLYTGGEGQSTAIFIAGWGTVNPYVDFYPLYEKIDDHTRFAVIDRFGYGYSDLTDRKRDIDNIVEEIHELLIKAEIQPPYILVGHSLGSLETIHYAQKYPDEVKGIVLLDGGSPEYYANQTPLTGVSLLQRFLVQSGVARTLYHIDGFAESLASERNRLEQLPNELKDLDRMSSLLKANNKNITDEMRQSQLNAMKVLEGKKPLDVPMTIITAGRFGKQDQDWMDSQAALTSWSSSGNQVILEEAEHYVHHYRPDLVAKEILTIVNE
ncbi:pimeloyl-ACP methyl ester carboxylesterase [Bacillus oleivorans]|uniref:Pimeloyl-ACP methyl ester carboxylesterase n=1 Tax=Bacillus oleivorans TaxID=1448271 RepID=A0A285CHQ7_9BACI|nr:alpha/beta hydrolase [Bacillus oleivorans]SNX67134.1 pimeloyl-ACP methyl ester carboxylesterase [Bacillus oleivorans]